MASEELKKKAVVGAFAAVMVGLVGYYGYGFMAPPPAAVQVAPVIIDATPGGAVAPVAARAVAPAPAAKAAAAVSTIGQLDPTLHMDGMLAAESLVYTGTGRNIFAPAAQQAVLEAVAVPKQAFPARPTQSLPAQPPAYTGPPPPQPVNLKFFGTATQGGVKKALLLGGDDVFLASKGDIVQRRYRIVNISANSIVVEDMPNTNQQTLPLLANP